MLGEVGDGATSATDALARATAAFRGPAPRALLALAVATRALERRTKTGRARRDPPR